MTMDEGGNEFAQIFLLDQEMVTQRVLPMVNHGMGELFGAMMAS